MRRNDAESTQATLHALVKLGRLERSLTGDSLDDAIGIREHLEGIIGPTIRPSVLAQALGIARSSLKAWIDRDEISTVLTRDGRREIPLSEAVELIADVDRARASGSARALGRVIRERHRRAAETADVNRLLPRKPGRTHRSAELQALAYHRAVAERLDDRLVVRARRRIENWRRAGRIDPRWADEWLDILSRPLPEVARAISSDAPRARELRQTTPFAGALTEQERRHLARGVEARGER